jgi:hypothetical protein
MEGFELLGQIKIQSPTAIIGFNGRVVIGSSDGSLYFYEDMQLVSTQSLFGNIPNALNVFNGQLAVSGRRGFVIMDFERIEDGQPHLDYYFPRKVITGATMYKGNVYAWF